MATTLELRFPGGRYHATPWGSHVNEGHVEWPPSPWRILRALLATGFNKLRWPPEGPPESARRLIEKLAGATVTFALPPASVGHSRHYVAAEHKKPLILDTWLHTAGATLIVVWDVDLDAEDRALLAELAEHMGYLGRAESLVIASLVAHDAPTLANCVPAGAGGPTAGLEAVGVGCTPNAEAYSDWRERQLAPILAEYQPAPGRKLTAARQKKRDREIEPYPVDLIAALCVDTRVLQQQGWSAPPGRCERVYWRRQDAISTTVSQTPGHSVAAPVRFALLALATPSRGRSSLPPPERTYPQGRLLHRALASVVEREFFGDEELALRLLGRTSAGPAKHKHSHAHLLALDLGDTGRLDHFLIFAPMGLDERCQAALRFLRRTYMKGGAGELQVVLSGLGDSSDLRNLPDPFGTNILRTLGPSGGACEWQSATPFVLPRHLKRKGRDSLEGQIVAECARRNLPEPSAIRVLSSGPQAREALSRIRHFVLHDATNEPPVRVGYAVELTYAHPVEGPVCLGYGSHAGLGRFEVAESGRSSVQGA
jgi:CRISPR-associated protein Csb2